MNLHDKTILLVGATSGIGRELVNQLSEKNCRLILFSRRVEKLKDELQHLLQTHRAILVPGDVRKPADIENLVGLIKKESLSLDGIIYSAGVSRPDYIDSLDLIRSLDTYKINFEGALRIFYQFLPDLMEKGGTFLAGFTSMAADRGMPKTHSYCASKAALDRLLECLRIDLLDRGVQVFTVAPGYVVTPMSSQNEWPMPGIWPVRFAVAHILTEIENCNFVIRFPWYHSWLMKLATLIPDQFFWKIMNKKRDLVKIKPRSDDEFSW
ncbi:SDR family NAD(P)-dependent oxidoreductase [bacterium]|nr:SDR family NAD(P)-dependent oxidoreductase [bacterium]